MQKDNHARDLPGKLHVKKQEAQPKPKLCKVCKRASFLKCMECDSIYCSSICQVQDWEEHQYTHSRNKSIKQLNDRSWFLLKPNNAKHVSVQGRLRAAVEKAPVRHFEANPEEKVEKESFSDKKIDEPTSMDVDEENLSTRFESAIKLEENQHPFTHNEAVDQTIRKMLLVRKFKRHFKLSEVHMDQEGFSHVVVTEIENKVDSTRIFWIMPTELKEAYLCYKKTLNDTYNEESVPTVSSMQELEKFKSHIVIAKIEGEWCRAQILSILMPETVALEDIDTGKKAIINIEKSSLEIKIPLESELMKSAFAFKVQLNVDHEIEVKDIISLKVTCSDGFGISQAVVKIQDSSFDESEQVKTMNLDKCPEFETSKVVNVQQDLEPQFIEQISVKDLHIGDELKILYCDGSDLEKGYLHVCDGVQENTTFYTKLAEKIAEHIKENYHAKSYKPVVRELLLAKYDDGCFYRAVCLDASDIDVKVRFLDYGNTLIVENKAVIPLPTKFLYECCSHTVQVKLASDRPISDIDAEETRESLMEKNLFVAKVELTKHHFPKYLITLNDSCVVFKK